MSELATKALELANAALASSGGAAPHPYEIGEAYLFRTVTFAWTGRVSRVTALEIVIDDAAWIADTGRFAAAITDGIEKQQSSEVEPVSGPVVLGRSTVIDAVRYRHSLPRSVK